MNLAKRLLTGVSFACLGMGISSMSMADVFSAKSAEHRVALLELYTSEGCSSCPPAEEWLKAFPKYGLTTDKVIPLAMHVTYWDYIGWEDPYAQERFDQRQRVIARSNRQNSVYTPQLVLNGEDFRGYRTIEKTLNHVNGQDALYDLTLNAEKDGLSLALDLDAKPIINVDESTVSIYIAVYENGLLSDVEDGENEGQLLQHERVVRRLMGPLMPESGQQNIQQNLKLDSSWREGNLGLVAFVEDRRTGYILQAVDLPLH